MFSENEKTGGLFGALPPKTAFFAGFVAGIMTFSTIGFVIMLSGGINLDSLGLGKSKVVWGANSNSNTNAAAAAPSPVAAPGDTVGALPPVTSDDHVRGDLNKAQVVLVEYSDFECPYCKTFAPTTSKILTTYGDKVALVYRHFPLSFHQNAQKEAEASECVADLGGDKAFWSFHDKIFERTTSNGTGFALDKLGALAKEVGVNQTKFQTCLDSGTFTKKVQDEETGGTAAGINGTPGTIILAKDGTKSMISGAQPFDAIKTQLDALIK
jgi:protein-disulfide isomerase